MQDWAFTRERLAIQEEDLTLFVDHLRAEKAVRDREQEEERAAKSTGRPGKGRPLPPERNTDGDEDKLEKHEVSVDDFTTAAEIKTQLERFPLVEFGPSAGSPFTSPAIIEFHTRPQ